MEETLRYPLDEDDNWNRSEDERTLELANVDTELPFEIPRD